MKRIAVKSSSVREIGYDGDGKSLEVQFSNGAVYRYKGVPAEVHAGLMASGSKGRFLAERVKDKYPFVKVS